jgi:Putative silver efflux pump
MVGGLVAAFFTSVCCIGPVVLAVLGVGVGTTGFLAVTAGFLKALLPYRPRGQLSPGYYVTWGGQFENQQRAMARLAIVVPAVIALIFLLLFLTFGNLRQAALILLAIPFAMVGGLAALLIGGLYLSVPASVGFIALFGIAVLNGVVKISYINQLRQQGMPLDEAVLTGMVMRLRPVLMTALVAALGLTPLLLATGPGSEIQRPLATVVIGGLISSTVLTLVVLPVLYRWIERTVVQRREAQSSTLASRPTTGVTT